MGKNNGPSASSFRTASSETVKTGFFFKKCGGLSTWASRYLVLDKSRNSVHYYKSQKDKSPRATIDVLLTTIAPCLQKEVKKGTHGFKFSRPGGRMFIFCSEDEKLVRYWLNELQALKQPKLLHNAPASDITSPSTPSALIVPPGMNPMMSSGQMPLGIPPGLPPPPMPGMGMPGMPMPSIVGFQPPPFSTAGRMQLPPGAALAATITTGGLPPLPPGMRPPMPLGVQGNMMMSPSQRDETLVNQSNVPLFRPRPPPPMESSNLTTTTVSPSTLSNVTMVPGATGSDQPKTNQPELIPHISMFPDNPFFPTVERDVLSILKIGRISSSGEPPSDPDFIGFKSKVVSRAHAEIWTVNGEFYIRDTKSQSGTFLNAMRLSEPGKESKPFKLHDNDIVQFGVDFRGSEENEAKCVSMKINIKMVPSKIVRKEGGSGGPAEKTVTNLAGVTLIPGQRAAEKTVVPGRTERTVLASKSHPDY